MALKNELSYSNSRASLFYDGCKRQYYLQYYGSWDGWNRSADKQRKDAYFLKKLTGMYAWAGSLVHEAIADLLKHFKSTGKIMTPEQLKDRAYSKMKSQWSESQRRVKDRIAKQFGLKEHEYNENVTPKFRKMIRDRVLNGIDAFYTSELFDEILESEPNDWLYIDDNSFPTFRVNTDEIDLKVFSIPDFARRKKDGTIVIYDWKTGKPKDEHRKQLALYSMYAVSKWNVTPASVEIVLFYTGSGDVVRETVRAEVVDKAREQVKKFVKDISQYLDGENPEKNKPKKKVVDGRQTDDMDLWPLTDDTSDCKWCNFERICGIKETQAV